MADARALLRAHRAENRIKHPHAAYSDAGKLLCRLCHDVVKTESLWDAHVRSQSHRQRVQALGKQQSTSTQGADESTQNKRKRGEDADDEAMSDADDEEPDALRTKRSKIDITGHVSTLNEARNGAETGKEKEKEKALTPPNLGRRTSGTPIQGVEIAIPSRPATPLAGAIANSAVSTPNVTSMGRSVFAGPDASSNLGVSTSASASAQQTTSATSVPISNDLLTVPTPGTTQAPSTSNTATTQTSGTVDEAEWAAFEEEIATLEAEAPAATSLVNGPSSNLYADAVIAAPAMTTAQLAAKSQEEENERRKHVADTEIADEREDATRALETEFEEMEELEGRVRRLKERREELRKESVINLRGAAALKGVSGTADGKENVRSDLDEDDEEDDEDEWDGFRFRA
jgi:zinc finger protein 830